MSTHIAAKAGEIAETILLPGDPLRAKWIAETFFTDVRQYNTVRNMFGFTGTWNGHRVSVQGSGMGQPSLSIYANELFKEYGVQQAIRVGTCGGLGTVGVRDVVIAMAASTDSNMNRRATNGLDFAPSADYDLLEAAVAAARRSGCTFHVGGIGSMDVFYDSTDAADRLEELGVLALEMEASALYTLAARYRRKALAILTVSDQIRTGEQTSSEERETGFKDMVQIALEAAFR
jgi:purine-nucleoside phosphorylase